MTREKNTFIAPLFAIVTASLVVSGCAGADSNENLPEAPGARAPESARPSTANTEGITKLVAEDSEDGLHFEVLAFPDGTVAYFESAPRENHSPIVTQADADALSPAEVFAKAIPGKPIPNILTPTSGPTYHATERTTEPPRAVDTAGHDQAVTPLAAKSVGLINKVATTSSTAPGQATGMGNCPLWWYQSKFTCIPGENTICAQYSTWAYIYNSTGISGSANVCVDSGTAQVVVSEGSSQITYSVPAGYYATFTVSMGTHCGWDWSLFYVWYRCDYIDQKFIEFSLSPTDAVSQFSATVNH